MMAATMMVSCGNRTNQNTTDVDSTAVEDSLVGTFTSYDLDGFKLHVYNTNDVMGDASYIIEGMNHWMTGFIDWNIVLDSIGGPNHVNNFAAAQVMIDYQNDIIYFTPYYYALKQFSRSMRPGDVVLGVSQPAKENLMVCAVKKADGSYAINMLNKAKADEAFKLRIGDYEAEVVAPANSVQTIFVKF